MMPCVAPKKNAYEIIIRNCHGKAQQSFARQQALGGTRKNSWRNWIHYTLRKLPGGKSLCGMKLPRPWLRVKSEKSESLRQQLTKERKALQDELEEKKESVRR